MLTPVFEGKVALTSFIFSMATILLMITSGVSLWVVSIVEVIYIISLLTLMYSITIVRVVACSHLLGVLFTSGLLLTMSGSDLRYAGFYAAALAFFHFSEYMVTSVFNPHTLTVDSFLINHSKEYVVAAVFSWCEYALEYYFFPGMKSLHYISIVGAVMVAAGEALRKVAMITAGSNFTHMVQYRKKDSHKLVTTGVYSLFRHPSYVGWFYWSIGTQVLLCNPVSLLSYAAASWIFFKERIEDEEESLVLFFGEDYIDYKKTVGTGIPFISGYPMSQSVELLKFRIK